MSKPISEQASKFWKLVSAPETASVYQQALNLTWQILQEFGKLVWLLTCLLLVGFDWFWTGSINAGRRFRNWFESIEQPSADRLTKEAGQALVTTGKSAIYSTLAQARAQLGLPSKPAPVVETTVTPKAPIPQPEVVAATPSVVAAPAVESPAIATSSVSSAAVPVEAIDDEDA